MKNGKAKQKLVLPFKIDFLVLIDKENSKMSLSENGNEEYFDENK